VEYRRATHVVVVEAVSIGGALYQNILASSNLTGCNNFPPPLGLYKFVEQQGPATGRGTKGRGTKTTTTTT
jgi:hypothetical protein